MFGLARSELSTLFAGGRPWYADQNACLYILVYWCLILDRFAISDNINQIFVHLNSAVFKIFICENRKLPFSLKHTLFQHLHKNLQWTAKRLSQMVNVAEHASSTTVHSSMKTIAWILFIFAEYMTYKIKTLLKCIYLIICYLFISVTICPSVSFLFYCCYYYYHFNNNNNNNYYYYYFYNKSKCNFSIGSKTWQSKVKWWKY